MKCETFVLLSGLPLVLMLVGGTAALSADSRGSPQAPAVARQDAPVPDPDMAALLERVAIVGASASAGFNLEIELGTPRTLAELLPAMLHPMDTHEILDAADTLTFFDPRARGSAQIDRVLEFEPKSVIAIDFLFWYAYGPLPEDDRAERFQLGLAQLQRLRCPVVVGDLPDMRGASSKMLPPEYVPSPELLENLNQRLAAWAKPRPHVRIMPMSVWSARLREGEAFEHRGERWEGDESKSLLQWDRLHPSLEGSFFLLSVALDQLDLLAQGALATQIDWKVRAIAERVIDGA